jgi:hypothetical protein
LGMCSGYLDFLTIFSSAHHFIISCLIIQVVFKCIYTAKLQRSSSFCLCADLPCGSGAPCPGWEGGP